MKKITVFCSILTLAFIGCVWYGYDEKKVFEKELKIVQREPRFVPFHPEEKFVVYDIPKQIDGLPIKRVILASSYNRLFSALAPGNLLIEKGEEVKLVQVFFMSSSTAESDFLVVK